MPAFDRADDARLRAATFDWLEEQGALHADVLPRDLLEKGFVLDGRRVPLVGPQGIFKPQAMALPLSVTTAPHGPYDDSFGPDELLHYRYRGDDPQHRDNVGLRQAMLDRLPLVYFHGIVPGKYLAAWPVFVVGDDPAALTFTMAVDDARHVGFSDVAPLAVDEGAVGRRQYVTSLVRRRLHQRGFRERIMAAYRSQCALCRFRHPELLDAAHIIADRDDAGEAVVQNGLALCKLHHAAYDQNFLGIRPDYVVEVRPKLLTETDGPTLRHGIQGLQGQRIELPRRVVDRPDPERLKKRFAQFLERAA